MDRFLCVLSLTKLVIMKSDLMDSAEENVLFTVITKKPEETFAWGERLAGYLFPGAVIALSGELGAGKTLFAQGIAKGLNITEPITSPTFTIINEYHQGRLPFFHIDAYRLEEAGEVEELGLEEYFNSSGVTLIEWPEQIKGFLPLSYLKINLKKEWDEFGHELRRLSFKDMGHEWENLIREFKESENIRN